MTMTNLNTVREADDEIGHSQEIVAPQKGSDMVGLPVATLFSHFPFALLEPLS